MPAQPVASSACWQAIIGRLMAALRALDDVIYFPETLVVLTRIAATTKCQLISTEVAVSRSLIKYLSQLSLGHVINSNQVVELR